MAQRIVADHLDANAQLKASAHSRGVDLPLELDAKYRRRLDRLTKLSGDEFDAKYTKMMVVDHKQDILRFKKQAAQGVEPICSSLPQPSCRSSITIWRWPRPLPWTQPRGSRPLLLNPHNAAVCLRNGGVKLRTTRTWMPSRKARSEHLTRSFLQACWAWMSEPLRLQAARLSRRLRSTVRSMRDGMAAHSISA